MTIDEIQPFGDRVLVRPDAKDERTEGGLHIPESVLADNPNYFYVSGVVLKLGDGYREDVYECQNAQCRYQSRRTVGEYCPVCKATQKLAYADSGRHEFDVAVGDRVLFGRFAGKQIEADESDQGLWQAEFTEPFQIGRVPALRDIYGLSRPRTKVLLMREVEILGILTGNEKVMPGYEVARKGRASSGLTADDGRGVVQVVK